MRLENRRPAEGINATHENPLGEFAWLVAGSLVLLAAAVAALALAAEWIAPRLPYRYEARLAARFDPAPAPKSDEARRVQAELQALGDRLAARMALPEGMTVRVGYRDEGIVNAYATLGGRVVFFRGLLASLGSEDALATVMAHELAHLKFRHPAAALGRGTAVGIVLSAISADLGRAAAGALGQAGLVTLFAFSREQERAADAEALRVLAAEYGHVGGAIDLFDALAQLPAARRDDAAAIEFLRTHPLTGNRVAAAVEWAERNGAAVDGARRPLPPAIAALRAREQRAS
ncbi:MAG: M48 family metallopeptidase [Pseudomonadota bacterium]